MQFTGKLTEGEYKELAKLTRSRLYWFRLLPRVLFVFWMSVFVLVVTLWSLSSPPHPDWLVLGIMWIVFGGLIAVSIFATRRIRAARFARLNATLPDQLEFTNDGLKWSGPNGAHGFLSWHSFERSREGRCIVLLYLAQSDRSMILPVTGFADTERESVRQFLRTHIVGPGK